MSRKVFILNEGGHDYSKAERFGELVFCTTGIVAKTDVNQMYLMLDEALFNSSQDDLIMLSSLTSLCSVASAYMAANFGKVNWLIYHDGDYYEKSLNF